MLTRKARDVFRLLEKKQLRLVLAESCTGGMISAALAGIPGVSEWLCGSFVVYRNSSKTRWLGIPSRLLRNPGPASIPVAKSMVRNALARTPEASIAAAITGHLGPNAPHKQDGLVYIAVALRSKKGRISRIFVEKKFILPQSIKKRRVRPEIL